MLNSLTFSTFFLLLPAQQQLKLKLKKCCVVEAANSRFFCGCVLFLFLTRSLLLRLRPLYVTVAAAEVQCLLKQLQQQQLKKKCFNQNKW